MRLTFFGDTLLDRVYRVNLDIDDYSFKYGGSISCIGEPANLSLSLSRWDTILKIALGKNSDRQVSFGNYHIMDFGKEGSIGRPFKEVLRSQIRSLIILGGLGNLTQGINFY